MPVRVAVLGPLRAEVDGAAVDLGRRRQRAVLARLAVAGGAVVSTDLLIDDLWHGEPPPRALGALQVHVSHLRRVLEPRRRPRTPATVLVSAPPGYALALGPDGLDSSRFTRLLDAARDASPADAEAALGEALAGWSGPAYAEFADERWAVAEVARLEELRLVAAEQRAQARLAQGRAAAAVPDLDRLVREHPLREAAVRLLAVALYRSGRQAEALAVLARTRRRLATELGVDPSPELRALERDVLAQVEHTLGPAPSAVPVTVSAPAPTVGLCGRDDELARLRRAADRVAGGVQLVLVSADAGGGKSALVEAFRAERATAGWTTALGRCPEVEGAPPAWAWRELMDQVPGGRADPRLDLLRSAGPTAPEQVFRLARAVVDLLASAARHRPVLLVLDDLHRAEGETLQLLRTVVAGLGVAQALLVATLRPAESGPDLDAALAALAGPVADRIDLPGLCEADVTALLARHGVGQPDAALAALVAERTGGNPLFVRELARLIAIEGPGVAADAVPAGVRDVLRRRLARLPAPARTVLRLAAVLGRDVDVEPLLRLARDDEAGTVDALELGVLSGLLVEPEAGRVRFTHALIRDTLYADMPRLRCARLHAAALDVLAAVRPDDPAALARHALAAGPALAPHRALEHVVAAARAADGFGAHREAARLWGAAVELGVAGPDVELRCAHVSALAHAGDVRAAVLARKAAVARARVHPDRASLDRVLVDRVLLDRALTSYDAPVPWTIRQDAAVDAELVGLLEDALGRGPDPALRCRLLVALVFELEGDDEARVRSASAEAMAVSAGLGDPLVRCAALNARFFAAVGPDLSAELAGIGAELLATADAAGHAGYLTQGHHVLFQVANADHDLDGAQRHADAALAAAPGGQLGFTLGWTAIFTALRALVAGDLDAAEAGYATVTRGLVAAGVSNGETMGLIARFAVRHALGRSGELADEVLALLPRAPVTFSDLPAAALAAAGRLDEARAVWRPDVALPRSYYWLLWTVLRAEVAVALDDREVAGRCYRDLQPWAGTLAGLAGGTVTLGPVAHVLADLAATLGRPDAERAAHLHRAVEVTRAIGAPHWADRARRALDR